VQTQNLPNNQEDGTTQTDDFEDADDYRVRLTNDAFTTTWNSDAVNVLDNEPGIYTPAGGVGDFQPMESVVPEASYVGAIIEKFQQGVFHADYHHVDMIHLTDGDVYPDVKHVMNDQLPLQLQDAAGQPTLENYNVLIVGSNVDHQVMTSAAAKQTIRDWVFAGGYLIVFGSVEQAVQWLQPIFHSAIDSANGGISTPDETHPILNVPNDLDYESYNTHDIVWDFRDQDKEHFAHVITETEGDYLALSNPGEFGDGRVLLASYQPFDLVNGQSGPCVEPYTESCEGLRLIHNFVTVSYQDLYMDYGPPIPLDRPHGSVVRLAQVDHPELGTRVVIKMLVYVF
jgi:hypothetical protein